MGGVGGTIGCTGGTGSVNCIGTTGTSGFSCAVSLPTTPKVMLRPDNDVASTKMTTKLFIEFIVFILILVSLIWTA
jgi:hypothetical protein